jgi:hypothetical protein
MRVRRKGKRNKERGSERKNKREEVEGMGADNEKY